jgi:hypothetical protein
VELSLSPVKELPVPPVKELYVPPVEEQEEQGVGLPVPPVKELPVPPVKELYVPPVEELYVPPVKELYVPPVEELYVPPVKEQEQEQGVELSEVVVKQLFCIGRIPGVSVWEEQVDWGDPDDVSVDENIMVTNGCEEQVVVEEEVMLAAEDIEAPVETRNDKICSDHTRQQFEPLVVQQHAAIQDASGRAANRVKMGGQGPVSAQQFEPLVVQQHAAIQDASGRAANRVKMGGQGPGINNCKKRKLVHYSNSNSNAQ